MVRAYVALVSANYGEMVTTAEALRTAVRAMLAARRRRRSRRRGRRVAARVPYYQTEAYRFYGGPIDGPADNVEGGSTPGPSTRTTSTTSRASR